MRTVLMIMLVLAMLTNTLAVGEQSPVTFAKLITDLVDAYENPSDDSLLLIDADVDALQDEVASSVADHWKAVYLDPDYQLLIHGKDDPAILTIPENGEGHAIVGLAMNC